MTASVSPAVRICLPRLLPAALFAVAAMLGGSPFGEPAVANAAPREWDIGAYDECVQNGLEAGMDPEVVAFNCCDESGGVWDSDAKKCGAPPADGAEVPITAPPGVPTQAPVPGPPKPAMPTQAPAPAPGTRG